MKFWLFLIQFFFWFIGFHGIYLSTIGFSWILTINKGYFRGFDVDILCFSIVIFLWIHSSPILLQHLNSFLDHLSSFPSDFQQLPPLAKALSWLRPTLVAHARPWSCLGQRWGSWIFEWISGDVWKFIWAKLQTWDRINDYWLVVWNIFFHTLGMSSSQLTNIIQRGGSTTNQIILDSWKDHSICRFSKKKPTSRLIPLRNPIIFQAFSLWTPLVSQVNWSEFPTSPWPSPVGQVIKHDPTPRSQFHHVIDVAPTVYEAIGIKFPQHVEGVQQMPLDGVSMVWLGESWNMMKHVVI